MRCADGEKNSVEELNTNDSHAQGIRMIFSCDEIDNSNHCHLCKEKEKRVGFRETNRRRGSKDGSVASEPFYNLFHSSDLQYPHRRHDRLSLGAGGMNAFDYIHALNNLAECGESLPVRVPLASEIERRKVAHANEK